MKTYQGVFEATKEGGFVGVAPEVYGAVSEGETLEEAKANLADAIKAILEVREEFDDISTKHDKIVIPIEL